MNFIQSDSLDSDGYRVAGERACCTVRATSAVLGISFQEAHKRLAVLGRKKGCGFRISRHLEALGLVQRPDLSCRSLEKILPEMTTGRFIVRIRHHVFAVIDGQICERVYLRKNLTPHTRVKMVYQVDENASQH